MYRMKTQQGREQMEMSAPRVALSHASGPIDWNDLRPQEPNFRGLGYADYFTERHKRKMLELARVAPSDVFYDLGCGNATVLIFAVKEFGVKRAIGFEDNPVRNAFARRRVSDEGLSKHITVKQNMFGADLSKADVILSMLMEYEEDYDRLFRQGVRKGTRLIKHDLPLIGFDYDDHDFPFYLIQFPLRRMRSPNDWAARVMRKGTATTSDVWHELYYYQYEKGYTKWDVKRFDRILRKRFP